MFTLAQPWFHENGVVWLRADVTKLHRLNNELCNLGFGEDGKRDKVVDVAWYLAAHSLWVFHIKIANDPAFALFLPDVSRAKSPGK